ncbi:type I-E CRISPR-associated protein Cas7/Cse4/CasC [Mycolicibacterium austroafricanum]|uniref:type I-E CRISPR-associated protein Cas7/Cse4/CasC n=1 Tax=Mycolicibacterium austroafricanum TaxID=39687 RepID=UPI0005671ADD|nr:type I-E CRISPR-associated protein Cas7/Cse4/CasC [Mycolicibacterium austroafricanum]
MSASTPATTVTTPAAKIIINVHALHPLAGSLLNRDDTGAQKTITVGGTLRTRISSQCWKRAARLQLRDHAVAQGAFAVRTNHLPGMVADALLASGAVEDIEDARFRTVAVFEAMGFSLKTETISVNSTFVHRATPAKLAALIAGHPDGITYTAATDDKPSKAVVSKELRAGFEALFDVNGAIDLALFGSFLATKSMGKRIDGAVSFNHAYSVDPARIIDDFFTAVDDDPGGVAARAAGGDTDEDDDDSNGRGAAPNNIGVSDLSAQVYYRTMSLDVHHLRRLLGGDAELTAATIGAAIESFVTSLPAAKQTSTNAATRPSLVVVTVGDARLSADNAFTRAITGDNVVADATGRLFTQLDFAARFGAAQHTVVLAGDADVLGQIPDAGDFRAPLAAVDTLDELVSTVQGQIDTLDAA